MKGNQREMLRRVVADLEKFGCDDNMERTLLAAGNYATKLESQLAEAKATIAKQQALMQRAVYDYNRWVVPSYGAVDGLDDMARHLEEKK